jgi:hypothetical protein
MGVELVSWGATGTCVAALLLAVGRADAGAILGRYAPVIAGLCITGLIALATVDRTRYPAFVRRLIGAEGSGSVLPWTMPLVHLIAWAVWAAHGVVLAMAVGVTELSSAIYAASFFVLAPIAGVIALPMPAGVGVRESFTVLGLVPLVGAGNALAAALISRAASLAADVVLWLMFVRAAGEPAALELPEA